MKKALILCLIVIFAVAMCACGNEKAENSDSDNDNSTEVVKIEKNVDAVAEALGLSGKSETFYEMIGADDGAEFNDGDIEIYQYDPESKEYKDIEAGKGEIEAAACNGGFILVVPDGKKIDQKIIDTFNELSF